MLKNYCARNPEIISKVDSQDTVNKLLKVANTLQDRKLDLNDIGNKVLNCKVIKVLIDV